MKKGLIILLAVVGLAIISIYAFIPGNLHVNQTLVIKGNQHGLYRALLETQKWEKWFPKEKGNDSENAVPNSFIYNNTSYEPAQKLFDGIEVLIKKENHEIYSVISIEALNIDSSIIQWNYNAVTGNNPITKISDYLFAGNLKHDLVAILHSLQQFLENPVNVYDINIQQEKVKDTFLITVKSVFPGYPDAVSIYRTIDKIGTYVKSKDAMITNFPMMHVEMLDSNHYETLIAVPVNRKLPDQPPFIFKRMVAGNILVTEIKGGRERIRCGFRKLEEYIEDYKKVSPALPFESLITHRLEVTDSSAWVTRIYYPIY